MPATPRFHIDVDCRPDRWSLRLAGGLDIDTGRQLIELGRVLGEGRPGVVEIDLAAVDFLDSSGLDALARTCSMVRAAGGTPEVLGTGSPAVQRLLEALARCGVDVDLAGGVVRALTTAGGARQLAA